MYGLGTIQSYHFNIVYVDRDEENEFDLVELENLIIKHKPKLFYLVPDFHNPTSRNLSLKQRNALYNLSTKYKMYILCDEAYNLLYFYEDRKLPPMFFLNDINYNNFKYDNKTVIDYNNDENEFILSCGTFSKLISPGLRTGYLLCHKNTIKFLLSLSAFNSFRGVNNFSSQIINTFIEEKNFENNLNTLRTALRNKMHLLYENLSNSEFFRCVKPTGGYFLWIELNEKVDIYKLKANLEKNNILVLFGEYFIDKLEKQKFEIFKRKIRITFGSNTDEVLMNCSLLLRNSIENSLIE